MSTTIHLTDNHSLGTVVPKECIADVLQIARLGQLQDHPNLLVFPDSFTGVKDKIGELSILITKEVQVSGNEITSLKVCTGNLMGFVGRNNTSVSIHSRFTHKKQDGVVDASSPDYFLYYMLQKVFAVNVFDLDHSTNQEDSILDFLLFLFPYMLKQALSQGLYKEYRNNQYDDARVRGVIDVNRFIRNDIPFKGKISYHCREHSYDNHITQLVRHTIEHIRRHPVARSILSNDRETMDAVAQIVAATPSYSQRERNSVLNANRRPIVHPYFLKYRGLQQLCVHILRHDALKYGQQDDAVHGVLFDGAWLWEEYMNTILQSNGFTHAENKNGVGGVHMFAYHAEEEYFTKNGRRMYPDFYREDCILDAKYKHLNGDVGREDLYQVISYMYCMDCPHGGYLYPDDSEQQFVSYKLNGKGSQYEPCDSGGILHVIPFHIPQNATSWQDFRQAIESSEDKLKQWIIAPIRPVAVNCGDPIK